MRALGVVALALLCACEPSDARTVEGRTFKRWSTSLDSALPAERVKACEVMAQFGLEAAPAAERLGELLRDPSEDVKAAAAKALPKVGPDGLRVAQAVLASSDMLDRFYASLAVVQVDPAHDKACSILMGALAGVGNERMSERARAAVVAVGAPLVPRLQKMLEDPYAPVRVQVLVTLGGIGPAAEPARDAVAAQLTHADAGVRTAALKAITRIGPASVVAPLVRGLLADKDEGVAATAADMLHFVAPEEEAKALSAH